MDDYAIYIYYGTDYGDGWLGIKAANITHIGTGSGDGDNHYYIYGNGRGDGLGDARFDFYGHGDGYGKSICGYTNAGTGLSGLPSNLVYHG